MEKERSEIKQLNETRAFKGVYRTYSHESAANNTSMSFGIYLPDEIKENAPVIYYLAGLTCTEAHFFNKATIGLKKASEYGIVMVFPDTSARDCKIEGEDDSWDFGSAAGFYIDATVEKYSKNYNNYTYITQELREAVNTNFSVDPENQSIMGHSMGGHGALTLYLKNPDAWKSCSAFAPITNPINC